MKKFLQQWPLFLAIGLALTFNSCKKDTSALLDDSTSAEDHGNVTASLDAVSDDATNSVGGYSNMSGKTDGGGPNACGFTVDTTNKANGVIVLNYDGSSCGNNNVQRTGSITITLQGYPTTHWRDKGAVLSVQFNNLKVTNVKKSDYVILSGTHTITNETGGLAWKIMQGDVGTVTHRHQATDFSITFSDGKARTWSVNRLRTFTNNGTIKTVTVSADHTEGNTSHTDSWGTNRNGVAFTNSIPTDITVTSANSQCSTEWMHEPASGSYEHEIAKRTVTVLFGVDANGDPVTSGCPYGYKLTYTKDNLSKSKVVSYWF